MAPTRIPAWRVLGSFLGNRRRQLEMSVDDVKAAVGVQASMIRMIESGKTSLPVERSAKYAAVLNQSTKMPLPRIDPIALAEAYVAARVHYGDNEIGDERHSWLRLPTDDVRTQEALAHVLLARNAVQPKDTSSAAINTLTAVLESMHPMQLQLVQDVAFRVQIYLGDMLSDRGVGEWEKSNSTQFRTCRALVTSLGSECSDPQFQRNIAQALLNPSFEGFHYILACRRSERAQVKKTWDSLKRAIGNRIREQTSKTAPLGIVEQKLHHKVMPFDDYRDVLGMLKSGVDDERAGWDALYLYNLRSGPDLMIGVFRRLPALESSVSDVTLATWGTPVLNQALPPFVATAFREWHERDWKSRK